MSNIQNKTKKGAAAIYVVIFTATLLSIIALSFIRLMLSESGRTTNYSLSQSAYNSALAGIEDAKIVLLRYQNCVNNGGNSLVVNGASIDCTKYVEAFTNNAEETSQDCDIIGKILGYNTENHETLIQTKSDSNNVTGSAREFDQAYTCVKISQKSRNYITTLTKNYPTKMVPIRTESAEATNSVNRIVLSWFSRKDLTTASNNSGDIKPEFHPFNSDPEMKGALKTNNSFLSNIPDYQNTFTNKPSVPSTIQATLIQTATSFKLSQFYSAEKDGSIYRSNRGSITLRPTTQNLYGITKEQYSNHIGTTSTSVFATSALKSQNTPLDVHCILRDNVDVASGYACNADIPIPRPRKSVVAGEGDARNYTTFFLVLNLPYGEPETEVNVELRNCIRDSDTIYVDRKNTDDSGCKAVEFAYVQPTVDATGRANDLFRRIEARIELVDTYFPIASYALAVNDPDNNEDYVKKDFYVTRNCLRSETTWDSTTQAVTYTDGASCRNAADRS